MGWITSFGGGFLRGKPCFWVGWVKSWGWPLIYYGCRRIKGSTAQNRSKLPPQLWSMFPLTRVPFWNSGFSSHSHMFQGQKPDRPCFLEGLKGLGARSIQTPTRTSSRSSSRASAPSWTGERLACAFHGRFLPGRREGAVHAVEPFTRPPCFQVIQNHRMKPTPPPSPSPPRSLGILGEARGGGDQVWAASPPSETRRQTIPAARVSMLKNLYFGKALVEVSFSQV